MEKKIKLKKEKKIMSLYNIKNFYTQKTQIGIFIRDDF